MIPKKIHYCWFGLKSKPEEVITYIEGWKKILPDYAIVEWNESNFDVNMMPFTKEAYSKGKYAFVSDVARLWALSQEGGFYLDTDIEMIKSFDDLLEESLVIGYEHKDRIGTGVIGCTKGNVIIEGFLKTYYNKNFILNGGKQNTTPNPFLLSEFILTNNINIKIWPMEYFCAKDYVSKRIIVTDNTYCVHHFAGSWQPKWKRILLYVWVPLTEKFPTFTNKIKHFLN